jgi:hypothetical protein
MMSPCCRQRIAALFFKGVIYGVVWAALLGKAFAAQTDSPWYFALDNELGGHFRISGSATSYNDDSLYKQVGTDTGYDGQADIRIKDNLFFSDRVYGELNYQMFLNGGDTYEKNYQLRQQETGAAGTAIEDTRPNDRRRLLNLTATIEEDDDYYIAHRLDRLLISLKPDWGDVTIGRQAVTWGNGLIFNPMDLFNPFAPTDTIRDYKVGDDLVSATLHGGALGELNFLAVPRRDPDSGEVDADNSSLAAKTHLFFGSTEIDFMLAYHYKENVAGVGISGYLKDAAYRADLTWSTLTDETDREGFFNLVLNLDYSWVLGGKNFYGLLEYFHSGLGKDNYLSALSDPELSQRLERGELYTLGKNYLAGQLQIELHPLFNVYLNVINNLSDPSGIIQPRAVWSISQQLSMNMGLTTYYGGKETEYGGFSLETEDSSGSNFQIISPESLYFCLTWYF